MSDLNAIHQPVLLGTCVDLVSPSLSQAGSTVVDCTLGLAGHAMAFLGACPEARLIGIDRDAEALKLASQRIDEAGFSARFTPVHAAFDEFGDVLDSMGLRRVQAVFMDLGLSSLQIDERERGFSYAQDAPLDMRMDVSQELTAQAILRDYDVRDLAYIFHEYGEERFSRPIAKAIVHEREESAIVSSRQLSELVDRVVPKAHRPAGNPAKRVFQALRIEVNGELAKLSVTLPQIAQRLDVSGRLVVESYHSLEDRTVKRFMAKGMKADVPPGLPVIPDDAQAVFKDLTHGAIKADAEEIVRNPRSASVRLRAVELTRELPARWISMFDDLRQESDYSAHSSHDHRQSPHGRRR
jgi:16S rRNA (cytosine1402-N4)-methyltransferase